MDEKFSQSEAFSKFQPVTTKRASEVIYDQIHAMILSGELAPGDRLPSERKMMELFQRSRPTIREGLRMLERNGFIKTIPGSVGAIVQAPNNKNIQRSMADALQSGHIGLEEMVEYRLMSESATVAWAVERREEADLAAMAAHLKTAEALLEDEQAFLDMDMAFHELVATAAKNHVSIMMNQTLSQINLDLTLNRIRALDAAGRSRVVRHIFAQHTAIYEAIRDQDPAAAQKAVTDHILGFRYDL